ncbi:hypothetical protein [Fusobacterium polymorphum]|jgi:hypothetical protein|uniref:CRISPR type III A-associated protein Csm2 n=2 Tax=Fusobacterium TaxID=848 RepID=A0A241Q147_FUSNP|nr:MULTISPECIES: hypothetical protein [Fusobacterium]ASG28447.1 hypothetical protein CBG61_05590 [Fusobacterium polymorphum]ETZ29913.1 hypothetical protein HMPREF2085_00311 [Fusobacterium nucleatum 13_3C]
MWTPKRKEKEINFCVCLNTKDNLNITEQEKKELNERLKREYFENNKDLNEALEKISLSQMNRFYSLLENSNFLLENDKIKEFVEKQLERALASKEGEDLKTSEKFYKYYEKNFLNLEKKERKITFDIMLNFVRYYEGVRKIDKIKEGEGN